MEIKDINLDDYDISTTDEEVIVLTKKNPKYPKWEDLKKISGVYIYGSIIMNKCNTSTMDTNINVFLTEKHAKSALAMAQISQLMPYYGGEITDEEWKDPNTMKCVIKRKGDDPIIDIVFKYYYFLAFHTEEQGYAFIENNEQLVKDYLMIE